LPALATAIPFDAETPAGGPRRLVWEEAAPAATGEAGVAEFERRAREARSDDVASLIYTSGTTGTPKGVLLTQSNFAHQVLALAESFPFHPDDLALSLLPLCHIYERTTDYRYLASGVSIAYAEGFDRVLENLKEVRPTLMAAVPRFFEKFYAGILERVLAAPAAKRKVFEWAVRVGKEALSHRLAGRRLPAGLAARYRLADALVYRRIRAEVGGRVRGFISGSAPLSREINEFLHAVGFTIFEGYGLTETSPVIAVNVPGAVKLGTVGRPIPSVEVRIADDGEILTRGPLVMKGYFKMEGETREALEGGWFHTGDIGALDPEGFLTITDRKKDLIKTSGGKMIAPQPIENQLKQSPYIQNAVVVGDRRRFVAVLLVPNLANLEQFARQEGIAASSPEELLEHPRVRALLDAEVAGVNRHLAQFEQLKRYAVLPEEFSFDNGQLTFTQKVRRRKIEEKYGDVIDKLYADERQRMV
jgi:long-chain acyl-CoA synthetase